ncbi:MAG: GNAT family N-acetyltransferase [Bacteroidota bacterium]
MTNIRPIAKSDLSALKEVLHTIELFPPSMLEEMAADFFNNPQSADIWFAAFEGDKAISIGYCGPEKLTNGTFNLFAIGVRKDIQGQGIGTQMMQYIENRLRQDGQRILIVETSSGAEFQLTRQFYEKLGYAKEAVIRDFWDEGDDKVVFWKKL